MAAPWRTATSRCSSAGSALGVATNVLAAAAPINAAQAEQEKTPFSDLKAELDEYGFIVLREVISRDDAARAEERVKQLMARRPDADKIDQHIPGFLNHIEPHDDEVFLPLVTQPAFIEFARSMLGEKFQMTETGVRWRKPGAPAGPIHASRPIESITRAGLPAPNVCFVLAFSWMLNDLTADMGATLYLPFSHHAPTGPRDNVEYKHLIAIEAPAGSVLVHHGGIWHRFGANSSTQARVAFMGGFFPYWMDPLSVGWQPLKKSVRDRMPKEVQERNARVIDG
jgi:ectoine hydroxylase-related dioxygenase (phytanoyl-CoA dioxygenase family)